MIFVLLCYEFQKYLEIEDQIEVEKRETQRQIDRLEHENKSLEGRIKSYQDHSECCICTFLQVYNRVLSYVIDNNWAKHNVI